MDLTEIRNFWEESGKALDSGAPVTATSRDPYLAALERQNVLDHLKPTDRVLEVGCGIGVHSAHYARAVQTLIGMDIAPSLLEHARRTMDSEGLDNIEFIEGSVLALRSQGQEGAEFDVVISQRCLINLPTWEHQREALHQIASVLRPGGLLLLTEGFQQELDALNEVRTRVGLPPIQVVKYNRNFRRDEFVSGIEEHFDVVDDRNYGAYLLLSRVLHPLIVAPDLPRHDGPVNRAAMLLSEAIASKDHSFDAYSYNRFFALKRR